MSETNTTNDHEGHQTTRKVHFDSSIDWEAEEKRSIRGWKLREKRKKRKHVVVLMRSLMMYRAASILMKARYAERLLNACLQSPELGGMVDGFLEVVRKSVPSMNSVITRWEGCAHLQRVHKEHGKRFRDWATDESIGLLLRLWTNPIFYAEFYKELRARRPGGP
eukprot:CAMPEP_0116132648 /NCGR_PEP_ID=MMETSP0329-20121206/9666_1 /TAXON_ID=697910 /ORGANISM="Pseudo-nitzschia arenysensis, Strain B593" /LENGTH=164 /DNA_ID=CAMNT_0003627189 /DNA_START=382 /DNA_END=876 /DNA_ORIENTATION=+